jgi:hypothetical protein
MTPGTHNIVIRRGGAFNQQLTFLQKGTTTPVDLTGLSPFTATVRSKSRGPLLVEITVADTDLDSGVLTLSIPAADTANLRLTPNARWDLMDANGNHYVEGVCAIKDAITELEV